MYMADFNQSLLNRRSIRKYSSKPVEHDLLTEILAIGARSSTTGNMQVYSVIVTRDEKVREELSPCHFNQKMIMEAPVVLTFCADFNRFNKWCVLNNAKPGYDNFLSFFTASLDAIIFSQTVCVAAEAKGLGICYIGTTTYMAHKIIEVLNLPKGVIPVTTITLGWPAEQPDDPGRLPLAAVVHNERYHDYSDAEIHEYYREKESRPDSRQFVKENNKETLAQVFTDVRYPEKDNVSFSKMLLQVLKDQGFM
jgi:nitroreductase